MTTEPAILPSENGGPPMFVPAGSRYEALQLRRCRLSLNEPRLSVVYSVFLMHRRTDLWGPDGRQFRRPRDICSELSVL